MVSATLGLAGWVAFDVYERSGAPGPRMPWAAFAAAVTLATHWLSYKRTNARRVVDDGEQVTDAAGVRHAVKHAASAGLLARDLPPELRKDLRTRGFGNASRHIRAPEWRAFVPVVLFTIGMVVAYWGRWPNLMLCAAMAIGVIGSTTYNPRPASMAAAYLKHRHCPACAYSLVEVPAREDGLTVCPECGAVWGIGKT